MGIISSREFRQNMGAYLDAVNNGKSLVIKTRSRGSFRISPIENDDNATPREAIRDAIRELKAYLKGESELLTEEEFWDEVNSDNNDKKIR
jgi:prevent-host-death family protein